MKATEQFLFHFGHIPEAWQKYCMMTNADFGMELCKIRFW